MADNTAIDQVEGIGGWLFLPTLQTAVAPVMLASAVVKNLQSDLPARFNPILMVDTVSSATMTVGWAWALYLLWQKKKEYPAWFNMLTFLAAVQTVLFTVWLSGLGVSADLGAMKGIVSRVTSAAIWIPYMLVSKRVRNTFVH